MTKTLGIILLTFVFTQEFRLVLTIIQKHLSMPIEEVQETRRKIIEKLIKHSTKDRRELIPGYELVTRKIIIDIVKFKNYGDVTTFSFNIKEEVSLARFTFQSEDIQMNVIGQCQPQNVIINIKRASFPAVNPDKYEFPKHFVSQKKRDLIHTIEMLSNGEIVNYFIRNPKPGDWYAFAYIKWQDPKKEVIKEKGLNADCVTFLYTDLQVKLEQNIKLIDCYIELVLDYADLPYDSKCLISERIEPLSLNITFKNTTAISDLVIFRIQALTFPNEKDYLVACTLDPKLYPIQTVTLSPYPNVLHYIHLERMSSNSSNHVNIVNCELYKFRSEIGQSNVNHTIVDFMRDDNGKFSTFEFGFPNSDIQDASSVINIKHNEIKTAKFYVNRFVDIGGNLIIKASLQKSTDYYMGYFRWAQMYMGYMTSDQFLKAVICVDIGHASIPLETGHCKFNDDVEVADFVLNSTDTEPVFETSIIPYPDSGTWYISMRLFCVNLTDKIYSMSANETKYEDTDEGADKEKVKPGALSLDEERTNKATLVLSVSSMSCIREKCSNHGICQLQSKDLAISFCSCDNGYGAWDCSDDSRMDSRWLLLLAVLLLSLSNSFFLVTVYVAIIRLYFTEAAMYTFTMVFSTFYHACDAPQLVAFCLLEMHDLLQFGDFCCGILCFWITLLAISIIRETLRNVLQLTGAVIIVILTVWDRHSIVTFAVPVSTGTVIVVLSWCWDYSSSHNWRYSKKYYIIYLPVGLFLASVGLTCYAFLQTEENYKIVHSFWHGVVAISVVFMLPDTKRKDSINSFLPSSNFCRFPLFRIFSKTRETPAIPTI